MLALSSDSSSSDSVERDAVCELLESAARDPWGAARGLLDDVDRVVAFELFDFVPVFVGCDVSDTSAGCFELAVGSLLLVVAVPVVDCMLLDSTVPNR
jgi:hypothetical protein